MPGYNQMMERQEMDVSDGDFHVEIYGKEQGFPPEVRRRLFLYNLKNCEGRTVDESL